jgi:signal transduction histidine kinase
LRQEFDADGFPTHHDRTPMPNGGPIDLEQLLKRGAITDKEYRSAARIVVSNLRTPLTGMMGYLAMLAEGEFGRLPGEQEKIVKELLVANQKAIRLINQLVELGKHSADG